MEQPGASTEYSLLPNNFITDAFNTLDEQYAFAVLAPAATPALDEQAREEPSSLNRYRIVMNLSVSATPSVNTAVEPKTTSSSVESATPPSSCSKPQDMDIATPPSSCSKPQDMDIEAPSVDTAEVLQQPSPKPARSRKSKKSKPAIVPGKWYCGQCDRNFLSKRGLIQHINSQHTGVKAYRCETCGKHFDRAEDRDWHLQRHVMSSKPHPCTVDGCARRYNTVFDRNRHVEEYHRGARHGCALCGKRFARKDHLQGHEVAHENDTVKKPKKKAYGTEQETVVEKAQEE